MHIGIYNFKHEIEMEREVNIVTKSKINYHKLSFRIVMIQKILFAYRE